MAVATKTRRPARKSVEKSEKPSVYDAVTARVIELLETGVVPWSKSWNAPGRVPPMPRRHGGEFYQGINILILWMTAFERCYRSAYWMTYQQAQELKAQVRKGEKATVIVYASTFDKKSKDEASGEERVEKIPFLKTYCVFNADQIDGLPEKYYPKSVPVVPVSNERRPEVDAVVAATGAKIRVTETDMPAYFPGADEIEIPAPAYFESIDAFYSVELHELAHWTGAKTRLARDMSGAHGSVQYAREELVAELASAFLCGRLDVAPVTLPRTAAYLKHWIGILQEDNHAIFKAATLATAAADYVLSFSKPVENNS